VARLPHPDPRDGPRSGGIGLRPWLDRVHAAIGYGDLDVTDLSAALRLTHDRLAALRRDYDAFTLKHGGEHDQIVGRLADLERRLRDQQAAVTELEKRVSTDGLRVEAVGLGLVGLGLILQAIGQAIR
jgi:hypothetical protein